MHTRLFLFSTLFMILLPAHADEIFIGTGSKSGVYYQAGRALCRLMDRHMNSTTCSALESAGSVSNISNVQNGALELGLVQSDIQHHAINHTGRFEYVDTPYNNIRAIFSLYTEPFTLVARRDAEIRRLDDIKGRRINIGNPGSGQRATMEVVMEAKEWRKDDFQLISELPASQQSLALCHDRVQAMVYTVGHPNPSVEKAIKLCRAVIAEVSDPAIDELVAGNPFYAHTVIPAGIYPGVDKPVKTFGVLATLVTSADMDEAFVYNLVKSVFENFNSFRRMHRIFGELEPEKMIRNGLSAPLHEGAMRYYREQGWME